VIARWTTVDPLAEKMRRFSLYDYGDDNSIRNIDPDGMETEDANCCGTPGVTGTTGVTGAPSKGVQGVVGSSNTYPATEGASYETISSTLSTAGTIVTGAGYAGSVFGPEVPAALLPLGEGLGTAGTGLSAAKDLKNGNVGSAVVSIALDQGFGKINDVIKDSKEITTTGKLILGSINFGASKIADKLSEQIKKSPPGENKTPSPAPKLAKTQQNKNSETMLRHFLTMQRKRENKYH